MNPNRDHTVRPLVRHSWPALLREPRLAQVDEELARVHRCEQAALLCEASELRVALVEDELPGWGELGWVTRRRMGGQVQPRIEPQSPLGVGAPGSAPCARAWQLSFRLRVEEELFSAVEDGQSTAPLLVTCRVPDPRDWGEGSTLRLARGSMDLEDTPEARAALVPGLLAAGRLEQAEAALSWLEARRWRGGALDPHGVRARLALARVFLAEARGELTRALFLLEELERGGTTGVALACGFALGVLEGRPDRAGQFLEQLEALSVPPAASSVRFVRARTRVWRSVRAGALAPACGARARAALSSPNPLAVAAASALIA